MSDRYRLSPSARADGHRLHVHDALGSTNAQALALARSGESGPLWIVTHRQSAGRGRRGSAWVSPEGNLAATLLIPVTEVAPERVATLGFVAGLALVRALDDVATRSPPPCGLADSYNDAFAPRLTLPLKRGRVPAEQAGEGQRDGSGYGTRRDLPGEGFPLSRPSLTRGPPSPAEGGGVTRSRPREMCECDSPQGGGQGVFRLKWPNDVLANNKKIAGILLEAEGRRAIAVGFGVNVAAAPEGLPYPATALAALGCAADAQTLLEALTARFVETIRIWNKGHGFPELRRAWMERAAGVGAPVSVRLSSETLSGRHGGIDEGGRLIILAPDGTTHTVTAGEVHFGEAATAA